MQLSRCWYLALHFGWPIRPLLLRLVIPPCHRYGSWAFVVCGTLVGVCVSVLIHATLMIRKVTEANRFELPRIPVATRAQYVVWIPVSMVLIAAYFLLYWLSPLSVKSVAAYVAGLPFVWFRLL